MLRKTTQRPQPQSLESSNWWQQLVGWQLRRHRTGPNIRRTGLRWKLEGSLLSSRDQPGREKRNLWVPTGKDQYKRKMEKNGDTWDIVSRTVTSSKSLKSFVVKHWTKITWSAQFYTNNEIHLEIRDKQNWHGRRLQTFGNGIAIYFGLQLCQITSGLVDLGVKPDRVWSRDTWEVRHEH